MKTLKALKAELLADPEIRHEYDQLVPEYEIARQIMERLLKKFCEEMAAVAPGALALYKRAEAGDQQAIDEICEAHRRTAERLKAENEEFKAELAYRAAVAKGVGYMTETIPIAYPAPGEPGYDEALLEIVILAVQRHGHEPELPREIVVLVHEIERLRQDCGEAYQVVGHLAHMAGVFDDPQVIKALDNLCDAADGDPRRHADLLPFAPINGRSDPEPAPAR